MLFLTFFQKNASERKCFSKASLYLLIFIKIELGPLVFDLFFYPFQAGFPLIFTKKHKKTSGVLIVLKSSGVIRPPEAGR